MKFALQDLSGSAHERSTLNPCLGAGAFHGHLVHADDHAAFSRAVLDVLAAPDRAAQSARAREFAQRFSWERFGREAIEALESIA